MSKINCSKCNKEIKKGDKFFVEIQMPTKMSMPVGRLDTIIEKKSINIYCESCK